MNVKADLVLLIFTLNYVTLVLLNHDIIQSCLCNDLQTSSIVTDFVVDTALAVPSRIHIISTTDTPSSSPPPSSMRTLSFSLRPPPNQQLSSHLSPHLPPLLLLSPPPPSQSKTENGTRREEGSEVGEVATEMISNGSISVIIIVISTVASSQVLSRYSRRCQILLPLVGMVVWTACGIVVSAFPSHPLLYLWLVGAAVSGLSGGYVTLKAAVTTYAVQGAPHVDSTLRLAILQASTSLGFFITYLIFFCLTFHHRMWKTELFVGTGALGVLNILIVFIFFSDDVPRRATVTSASVSDMETDTHALTPEEAEGQQITEYDSGLVLDHEDEEEVNSAAHIEENKCERITDVKTEGNYGDNDEYEGEAVVKMNGGEKKCKEEDERSFIDQTFPIDIVGFPLIEDQKQMHSDKKHNTEKKDSEAKEPEGHKDLHSEMKNSKLEEHSDYEKRGNHPSLGHHAITIIISSEDGGSVYGTPSEHLHCPPTSRYGTPPSRALSNSSLAAAVTDNPRCSGTNHLPPHEVQEFLRRYQSSLDHYNRIHHTPQYQGRSFSFCQNAGVESTSAPSTFSGVPEVARSASRCAFRSAVGYENKPTYGDSHDELLLTPNVLLTRASSFGSMLDSESTSSVWGQDAMHGGDGDSGGNSTSLGDLQRLSPPISNTGDTVSSQGNISILEHHTVSRTDDFQIENMNRTGERRVRGSSAPLTLAIETSGEGERRTGGEVRCRVCVAATGGSFCHPVSVTFRRRAAGLRGIVVADVVAALLVSFVEAAVSRVTPLYLEAKAEWSLSSRVLYLACCYGLSVVALVVVLPLVRRWVMLRPPTLGLIGGVSSFASSVLLSSLSFDSSLFPLAPILGLLTQYLNVASTAILVQIVSITELGGVLVCLGSTELMGQLAGWISSHYLFSLLLNHNLQSVFFLATSVLIVVPLIIFGVLYFSLGLRQEILSSRAVLHTSPPLNHQQSNDELT